MDDILVVAAVIFRQDRVLICQRPSGKRHAGLWEFPGGKLHDGETALEAARRELREELAVDVTSLDAPLSSFHDPGSAFRIMFCPVAIVGEPVACEHTDIRWVRRGALLALDLAPADRRFAETLENLR